MSLRLPTRLLDKANIEDAYPRELVADFSNGELVLVDNDGKQIPVSTPHIDIEKDQDEASEELLDYSGSFEVVKSINRDEYGHVVSVNTSTVTLPDKPTSESTPYKYQLITQEEYDALTTPDENTLYLIEV